MSQTNHPPDSNDPELDALAAAMERELSDLPAPPPEASPKEHHVDLHPGPDPMRLHRRIVGAYVTLVGVALGGFVAFMGAVAAAFGADEFLPLGVVLGLFVVGIFIVPGVNFARNSGPSRVFVWIVAVLSLFGIVAVIPTIFGVYAIWVLRKTGPGGESVGDFFPVMLGALSRHRRALAFVAGGLLITTVAAFFLRPEMFGREPTLIRAALQGRADRVERLLENGANANQRGLHYTSAMAVALGRGDADVVRVLLEHGADWNEQRDPYQITWLVDRGNADLINLLLEHGAKTQDPYMIAGLARGGNVDLMNLALEYGADVNARDPTLSGTALTNAVAGGHLGMVDFLLEHGADVNASDNDWGTALMSAANDGRVDMANLLLDHGADVNALGPYETTLMSAAGRGHLDMVNLLLEHGADVNGRDSYDRTALMSAVGGGNLDVVNVLLEHGSDVTLQDQNGRTALMMATYYGNADVMAVLAALSGNAQ